MADVASPPKTAEYYKSLQPSQLIAERGDELVVINPGSSHVRVGFGSSKMPKEIPHCIAWRTTLNLQQKTNGSIGDQMSSQTEDSTDREDARLRVEAMLGIDQEEWNAGEYEKCTDNNAQVVQWTSVKSTTSTGTTYRSYFCGDEALRIPPDEPYTLRRPMCRGRLNVSDQYTIRQVCDDIHTIWNWILREKLVIDRKTRRLLSAVLIVPDTLDTREVKELISVVLKDLEFLSVVVHQECIAATFGNGIPSACVVQIGAHMTTITCVEDGVSITMTRKTLPYGGEDISRCLLWVQQEHNNWPPIGTNPVTNALDLVMFDELKETHCIASPGRHTASAEIYSCTGGEHVDRYRVNLVALNVPPAGLFYPSIFALEERKLPPRPRHYSDHEDMLVETLEVGGYCASESDATVETGDAQLGLHEAIVESICTIDRYDIKAKLFSTILLVGGVASTEGLPSVLEDKVLEVIPRHEGVEKVEVLPFRVDPAATCWKGGVLLGVLDFSRDSWLHRADWLEGGPRVGSSKKYKDSISLHGQVFWYNAVLE